MNQDQIFDVLTDLLKSVQEPERPEGCFLALEYAAAEGIAPTTARYRLREMKDDGLVEPVKFKVQDEWGEYRTRKGWKVVKRKPTRKRK